MINHVKLQIYEVALYKLNALFRIFLLLSSLVQSWLKVDVRG
jgi:hypothetical protein